MKTTRQVGDGIAKFADQLLLPFMLMIIAAWSYSQPIAALPDRVPASSSVTAQQTPSATRTTAKALTMAGKVPAISSPLHPSVSAFQHTAPPSPSSAASPEFSPIAAPTASTPSPAPKPSTPALRPHPLATHRPVTPPSRPSTVPEWSYSRPQPYPHSSDSLPPDTMDTLPPPPPPLPFTSIPTILPAPTVSTPIPDPAPSESKSVLNGGVTAGIVIGGISAAALVAMVAFILGKRKANITRAQYAHAVRGEQL